MEQTRNEETGFFDVIMNKQTYLSMIYLMLAFPLGIFYFVFTVTGLSAGIGLIPVFIGIPVLYVFVLCVKGIMRLERKMAAVFLGIKTAENVRERQKGIGILIKFRDELFCAEFWRSLAYLNLKFIMGIVIFVLCVSLASLSIGLISAPVLYHIAEYELAQYGGLHFSIDGVQVSGLLGFIGISAAPEQEMLIFMLLGMFVGIGSLHIFNKTAYFMGHLLKIMSP